MLEEKAVITAIKTILESIKVDDVAVIKEVFDHIPNQYTKYPSAYITPRSWQEDYIDLRDTGNTAIFRIGLIYTLDPDPEDAQIKLRETVALVRTEFAKQENIKIGNTVDWSQLTSGRYDFDTKDLKVAICEIDLSVRKRYSRY